ncbi:hypothetical protein B0J17DRAFT_624935 [Rhizoctonia solani]|nr:hypothetical protein B0J17DRAFT_624935 [Rhizoctonia solani]
MFQNVSPHNPIHECYDLQDRIRACSVIFTTAGYEQTNLYFNPAAPGYGNAPKSTIVLKSLVIIVVIMPVIEILYRNREILTPKHRSQHKSESSSPVKSPCIAFASLIRFQMAIAFYLLNGINFNFKPPPPGIRSPSEVASRALHENQRRWQTNPYKNRKNPTIGARSSGTVNIPEPVIGLYEERQYFYKPPGLVLDVINNIASTVSSHTRWGIKIMLTQPSQIQRLES